MCFLLDEDEVRRRGCARGHGKECDERLCSVNVLFQRGRDARNEEPLDGNPSAYVGHHRWTARYDETNQDPSSFNLSLVLTSL